MQIIKQLGTFIEQATQDANNQPPINLYQKILAIINSRVDMPKHTINAISKRLTIKSRKVLFYCFDLLQYLSFRCELALYTQISSKQFLLKISGILMNQQMDQSVKVKALQTIKCWEELFRPHEDLLPMYFQFYAGILRKEFPIEKNYLSPYKPKDFKIYKKVQPKKNEQSRQKPAKQIQKPTKVEMKTFEQMRQKLILTNEIIDNVNPATGVKGNEILLQMIEQIKTCEKKINETINENPNEKIMELALAVNDDIYITYRRFKDLQKNRKPEPFILTELPSDIAREKQHDKKEIKKKQSPVKIEKAQEKPKDIFDSFEEKPRISKIQPKKEVDIFDIACEPKATEKKETALIDMDIGSTSQSIPSSNNNIFDLLGGESSQQNEVPFNFQQNSGFGQPYQTNSNFSLSENTNIQGNNPYQSNNFANISLGNAFQTQNDLKKYDNKTVLEKISQLTDLSNMLQK